MTYRLLLDVVEGIWGRIYDLALNLICPTTVVPQASNASTNITLGHGESLAIVQRLNSGQKVNVFLEQVGELVQQLASSLGSRCLPLAIESLARGSHCDVDILLCRLVDGADNGLVCWVDDLKGLAVYTLVPFIVDEAGWKLAICHMSENGYPRLTGQWAARTRRWRGS